MMTNPRVLRPKLRVLRVAGVREMSLEWVSSGRGRSRGCGGLEVLCEAFNGRRVGRSGGLTAAGSAAHSATHDNVAGHHRASSPVRLPGGQGVRVVSHGAIMTHYDTGCQFVAISPNCSGRGVCARVGTRSRRRSRRGECAVHGPGGARRSARDDRNKAQISVGIPESDSAVGGAGIRRFACRAPRCIHRTCHAARVCARCVSESTISARSGRFSGATSCGIGIVR